MPNNMGVVRYFMAFSVLIAHFNHLDNGSIYWPLSSYNAVGGFFAISGFLMAGSYLRKPDWKTYLIGRCRRILPPYWATVVLFAILLGFCSASPDYFLSGQFWKYLIANLCFVNFVESALPGVFDGMEVTAVNGSLWTMKVEWMLYLSMPFASYFLVRWRRHPIRVVAVIYISSMIYRAIFTGLYHHTGAEIYNILSRQFMGQLMFFYSGVLVYYYFDLFMRWRWWILPIGLALTFGLSNYELFVLTLKPLVISLLTLWFCMVGKWGTWEGRRDNISYNIYLVHYPVCQLAAYYLLPQQIGMWWSFAAVCAATISLSWLINIFVEKPFRAKRPSPSRPSRS